MFQVLPWDSPLVRLQSNLETREVVKLHIREVSFILTKGRSWTRCEHIFQEKKLLSEFCSKVWPHTYRVPTRQTAGFKVKRIFNH